ncbi:MAG: response regulator transcription factor [Filimonas sp.]|nr:response regulator transcription factor [Filimonas sp.]
MKSLKVAIIDDEPDSTSLLELQLRRHCPQLQEIRIFNNSLVALEELELLNPDLVFLDIEMPGLSGFELLEKLTPFHFSVIFITAYNQYALKAFRFNAINYLVKPVDTADLAEAVNRAVQPSGLQLAQLKANMQGTPISKIAISSQHGVSFIELKEIIYAEASSNYSKLLLTDGRTLVVAKTLKDIQDVLEESHFLRIHRQYIVNLNEVSHFNKNDGLLTMQNKTVLPVARAQKDKLAQKYNWL